jgi:hypothetical protein
MKDYVQRTPTRIVDNFAVSEWCREMTAADLGLPLGQWSVEWLTDMYGKRQRLPEPTLEPIAMDFVLGRWTNAPYAVGLGAEG